MLTNLLLWLWKLSGVFFASVCHHIADSKTAIFIDDLHEFACDSTVGAIDCLVMRLELERTAQLISDVDLGALAHPAFAHHLMNLDRSHLEAAVLEVALPVCAFVV